MSISNRHVIGYFHICQKNGWERSFDLIYSYLKKSGLYDRSHEIRCGVVNDDAYIVHNTRFDDPKLKIIVYEKSDKYERPTLLHMKEYSNTDPVNTAYYYLHTKGLRHYGTETEQNVIDWIKLLLYWNITKWEMALNMLYYFDTYGCNACFKDHYSGNFWWTNIDHVKALPNYIEDYYIAPERWVCAKNDVMFNIYSSGLQGGSNYYHPCPEHTYFIPDDFNIDAYKYLNESTKSLHYDQIIDHYLNIGRHQNLVYKLPEGFDFDFYREKYNLLNWKDADILLYYLNGKNNTDVLIKKYNLSNDFDFNFYRKYYNFIDFSDEEIAIHWINYGKNEGKIYIDKRKIIEKYNLPDDFDFNSYKKINNFMDTLSEEDLAFHWDKYGKYEGKMYKNNSEIIKKYKLPNDFDFVFYKKYNNFIDYWSDEQLALHWIKYGQYEGKIYKDKRKIIEKYNLPNDFDFTFYKIYNNFIDTNWDDEQLAIHWIKHGLAEGRLYKCKNNDEIIKEFNLPDDFDFNFYKTYYDDITPEWSNEQIASHWINHGIEEGRIYKCKNNNEIIKDYNLPDDFDFNFYRTYYDDITPEWTNENIALHWVNYGKYEKRKFKINRNNDTIKNNIMNNS